MSEAARGGRWVPDIAALIWATLGNSALRLPTSEVTARACIAVLWSRENSWRVDRQDCRRLTAPQEQVRLAICKNRREELVWDSEVDQYDERQVDQARAVLDW